MTDETGRKVMPGIKHHRGWRCPYCSLHPHTNEFGHGPDCKLARAVSDLWREIASVAPLAVVAFDRAFIDGRIYKNAFKIAANLAKVGEKGDG
jgi:hypothetical protein